MPSNCLSSILRYRIKILLAIPILSFIIIITLTCPAAAQEADIDAKMKDRLMSGMDHLEALSKKTSGRGTFVWSLSHLDIDLSDGRVLPASRTEETREISVLGDQFIKEASIEKGVETLKVANSEYAFVLTRPKDGVYAIAGIGKIGASRSDDVQLEERKGETRHFSVTAYYFFGRPFGNWFAIQGSN